MSEDNKPNPLQIIKKLKSDANQKLSENQSKSEIYTELADGLNKKNLNFLKNQLAVFVYKSKRKAYNKINLVILILFITSSLLSIPLIQQLFCK